MGSSASFKFYFSLNDFLPPARRGHIFLYHFTGTPAVKDAIEAIGVPHPEVDVILINGAPVDFKYRLQPDDAVQVYPATAGKHWPEGYSLQASLPASDKFVLDVHVGKLARALRLLGFDTNYQNDYTDSTIAKLASIENRIVLTRDVGLLKHTSIQRGYWLRSQHLEEQLSEVIAYFRLWGRFRPFTRCLECNGLLAAVPKEEVLDKLPPRTRQYFQEFYQCRLCKKVYWKGSHYERMQAFVQSLKQGPLNG